MRVVRGGDIRVRSWKRGINPETVWGKRVSGTDEVPKHKLAWCV